MEGFKDLSGLLGIQGVINVVQMKQVIAWTYSMSMEPKNKTSYGKMFFFLYTCKYNPII